MSPPAPPGASRHLRSLAAALALMLVAVGVLVAWSWRYSSGHLVYALDDAYIHLAMARNLAEHGVFGVTRYGFTSSSSSPLWTLVLAGVFAIFGARDWVPLAFNVLFAASLLAVADRVLQTHGARPRSRLLALVAVVVLTPVPPLVLVGQEHLLHATLTLVFAALLTWAAPSAALLLVAPALTATRYEGLFLVFIACLVLAARRRSSFALALGVVSLLPPAVYGLVSLAHGWYALPNPVILKGALGEGLAGWGRLALVPFLGGWGELVRTPHVLALVMLAAVTLVARWRSPSSREGTLLIVFIGTAILHLQYARTGWFYRYEAYLVVFGIVAAAVALDGLGDRVRPRWLPAALASAVALVCAVRGVRAHLETPGAVGNIYEQQIQMGRFLARYYPGESVAANDIGAIDWLADLRVLDLWGLASREVAEAKLTGRYTTAVIAELARSRGDRVAVIYERWLDAAGGVPPEWIRAGRWRVARNVVLGDRTVAFYAVDPTEAAALADHLRVFAPELPPGVAQMGPYTR
ncbi:MAG: hypothetical protein DMF83_09360 [Acidobacteria bacterium]|nr:MAG: hypothetical protein DMF83_09360 [Acidobacteriota bacterium]